MKKIIIIAATLFLITEGYSQTTLSLQESKDLAIKNNVHIKKQCIGNGDGSGGKEKCFYQLLS